MTYLTRAKVSKKIPVTRKGKKYVAKATSHFREGVPVVIAVRDMLKMAKNLKEVRLMIRQKSLKINNKLVKDAKEGIRLFNVLEVGKDKYKLILLPSGRFNFETTSENSRICKVTNKSILGKKIVQINFHDGTNSISKEKIKTGDSVELDFSGKIVKVIPFEKGKNVFVYSGRSIGLYGKIESISGRKAQIKFEERSVELDKGHFIVLK